ncbi:MAG: type II secretion system F family protein [bacterium]
MVYNLHVAEFRYTCFDRRGKQVRGRLEAATREGAIIALRQQGMVPTAVNELHAREPARMAGFGSVSVKSLAVFTRKLSALLKTDIPITEIFEILAEEEESLLLAEAAKHVATEVIKGKQIGVAMTSRPRVFTKVYIRMIEAGLASGTLDKIADSLAKMYEAENALRQNLWSKLTYPVVLLIFCFLSGFILRGIGYISGETFAALLTFWLIVGGLTIAGFTRTGYAIYREIFKKLPLLGPYIKKIGLSRFCKIFGLQYAAGVPLIEGLEISKEVILDHELIGAINRMENEINQGRDLREAMTATGVFPKRIINMIGVGEKAGGVELMLEKLAEYYDLEIDTGGNIMVTLIYFLVYMIVALTIAIIVISAYSHYFGMISELIENT